MTKDEQFERWWSVVADNRRIFPLIKSWAEKGFQARNDENAQLRERIVELEQDVGEYRRQICTTKDGLYLPHEAPLTTNETINHLRSELEQLRWQYEQQHDQLAQRDSEIVELRKDRERLEWFVQHHGFVYEVEEGWYCDWWSEPAIEGADCDTDESENTWREAIDAAIAAAEVKGDK